MKRRHAVKSRQRRYRSAFGPVLAHMVVEKSLLEDLVLCWLDPEFDEARFSLLMLAVEARVNLDNEARANAVIKWYEESHRKKWSQWRANQRQEELAGSPPGWVRWRNEQASKQAEGGSGDV